MPTVRSTGSVNGQGLKITYFTCSLHTGRRTKQPDVHKVCINLVIEYLLRTLECVRVRILRVTTRTHWNFCVCIDLMLQFV